MNPGTGGSNTGGGNSSLLLPATGLGMDPFTSSAAGGNDMSGGFPDSSGGFGSLDDPANVTGDPFFDPVFGSQMMGTGQEGFPGQTPYVADPDQQPRAGGGDQAQPSQEQQPTSAAGGPRAKPQPPEGMFGGLSPLLKQLANVVSGGQPKGPTSFMKQGADVASRLGGFLSGQPQKPQPGRQGQQAPQGTEGGGEPGTASPPTATGAPPSMPQDTATAMAPRPPVSAAFPTTLSHLAQVAPQTPPAMPGPSVTGPTPPLAAAPEQGAGPGAAPMAASGAAPGSTPAMDPQVAAIAGNPQQAMRDLLEGRTQIQPPPPPSQAQIPTLSGTITAPTPQDVSRTRLAGSNTAPTEGFSQYLAQERQPYAKELDDPRTALRMAAMMSFEHESDPVAVAESLMNRTKYSNSTLSAMLSPRFYGPMRKPRMFARRMAELQRDPARLNKLLNAARTAANGTNLLGGATDQGSGRDPNVNHRGGRVIRHGEVYNDWGGGPGGHAGAARFREEQQRRVRGANAEPQPQEPPAQTAKLNRFYDPSRSYRELEGERRRRESRVS